VPLAEKTSVTEIRAGRHGSKCGRGLSAARHAAARHRRSVPAGTDSTCGRPSPDHPCRKVRMRTRRASRSPKLAPKGARRGAGVERLSLWVPHRKVRVRGVGVRAPAVPGSCRQVRIGDGEREAGCRVGQTVLARYRESLPAGGDPEWRVWAGCRVRHAILLYRPDGSRREAWAEREGEPDRAPKGVADRPSAWSFRQVRPRCERRLPASMHAAHERSTSWMHRQVRSREVSAGGLP